MSQHSAIDLTVGGLGYELVDVERAPGGLLRVTIDIPADPATRQPARAVTVDDCERVTRQLQHVLEVEGLAYERLEVSSPGLDRPLKKAADFARFAGEQVEVTLKTPFRGRKRYRGELQSNGEGWRVVLADRAESAGRSRQLARGAVKATAVPEADEALEFSLDEVREARLVPVIDFKGRRATPQDGDGALGGSSREDVDGDRIQ
ncbi:MAG: ribosome maturation factor RimP [Caldimonas sp.]